MSTHTIYRVTCDAPHCSAVGIIEKITDVPDGWRRVSSADHLADWRPGRRRNPSTGRQYTDKRSPWDVSAGSFALHLCPADSTAFDGHLPRTEGAVMLARERDRRVLVSCSCGALSRTTKDLLWVGRDPMPTSEVERTWWLHLPAELQEYATRGRVMESA
ncbi:hypothetical protein ACQEVC_45605 [Plantactinospora sp. CA-294935]|uniref:hypothetical protein n=1 Tax=Plantactinospora sp. CA-294935 TaxID=3240012 RepID=UPI003D921B9B